jgi:hypothetical protein
MRKRQENKDGVHSSVTLILPLLINEEREATTK